MLWGGFESRAMSIRGESNLETASCHLFLSHRTIRKNQRDMSLRKCPVVAALLNKFVRAATERRIGTAQLLRLADPARSLSLAAICFANDLVLVAGNTREFT
jgi:hypothetical protein